MTTHKFAGGENCLMTNQREDHLDDACAQGNALELKAKSRFAASVMLERLISAPKRIVTALCSALLIAALAAPSGVIADDDDDGPSFGLAGILSNQNREDLPKLILSSVEDLASAPLELRSGAYYTLPIESDGSQELALEGAAFFRAVWIDEVVVNDLEIRPYGLDSLEFDDEGLMEIKFVAIKPGSYHLKVPNSTGPGQRVDITIR